MTLLRLLTFLLAFKVTFLCKVLFYIEILLCALSAFMPRKAYEDGDYMAQSYFLATLVIFCLFYCNFWSSLVTSYLVNAAVQVA